MTDGDTSSTLSKLAAEIDGLREGQTLSLNELAKRLGGDPSDRIPWRRQLRAVTNAAMELQREGRLRATRKGKPIDLASAKGVVRFGQARPGEDIPGAKILDEAASDAEASDDEASDDEASDDEALGEEIPEDQG